MKLRQRIYVLEETEEDKKGYLEEENKTEAMCEGLFEFAPAAIVVFNREDRIVQAYKQTERLFGYTSEELLSVDHDVLLPERFRERHREHCRGYISDSHVRPVGTGLELYGKKKDSS